MRKQQQIQFRRSLTISRNHSNDDSDVVMSSSALLCGACVEVLRIQTQIVESEHYPLSYITSSKHYYLRIKDSTVIIVFLRPGPSALDIGEE